MSPAAVAILCVVIAACFAGLGWLLRQALTQPLETLKLAVSNVAEDVTEIRTNIRDDRTATNNRISGLENWSRRHVETMHRRAV